MGAESDQTLKLLIQLGVIGQDDAKAAKQLMDETGDSSKKAGENIELLNFHGREMHRLMGELNRLMPGLGEAMRAAMNPEMLGLALTLILVGRLVEMVKEWREEAKKAAEEVAKAMTDAMKHSADATLSADKVLLDYQIHLQDASSKADSVTKAEDAHLEVLKQQTEEYKKILEAMEKVSPGSTGGRNADADGEKRKIADMQTYLADAQQKEAGLKAESDRRVGEQAAEASRQATQKPVWEAQRDAAAAEIARMNREGYGTGDDDQKSQLNNQKRLLAEATEALREMQANEATAAQRAKDATAAYDANEKAIQKWTEAIAKAQEQMDIQQRGGATIAGIEKFMPAGAVQGTMAAAVQAIIDAKVGHLTQADKDALGALHQLTDLVGMNIGNVMKALSTSANIHATSVQEMNLINQRLQSLEKNGFGG